MLLILEDSSHHRMIGLTYCMHEKDGSSCNAKYPCTRISLDYTTTTSDCTIRHRLQHFLFHTAHQTWVFGIPPSGINVSKEHMNYHIQSISFLISRHITAALNTYSTQPRHANLFTIMDAFEC